MCDEWDEVGRHGIHVNMCSYYCWCLGSFPSSIERRRAFNQLQRLSLVALPHLQPRTCSNLVEARASPVPGCASTSITSYRVQTARNSPRYQRFYFPSSRSQYTQAAKKLKSIMSLHHGGLAVELAATPKSTSHCRRPAWSQITHRSTKRTGRTRPKSIRSKCIAKNTTGHQGGRHGIGTSSCASH